jgi:hypothetical protein
MKRIAICISGHIRGFSDCYENINKNFLTPLKQCGYKLDFFISLWNTEGHRQLDWKGKTNFNNIIEILSPKMMFIEEFDREYFINRFNTSNWEENKHLSGPTTCGDSVSMWYMIKSCFDMVKKYKETYNIEYDIITRLRPDILFDTSFNTNILSDILVNDNVVYIPKWHGKWFEISRTITDYFGIGSYKAMSIYMSVYSNINILLGCDKWPHTGEGLLCGQLDGSSIVVKRLNSIGFSVLRKYNTEKVV